MRKSYDDLFLTREMFRDAARHENLKNVHSRKNFEDYIARYLLKNENLARGLAENLAAEFVRFFAQEEIELKKIELQAEIAVPEFNNHAGVAPAFIY